MQESITTKKMHSIKLDGGRRMNLTGISEVVSFNDTAVLLKSDHGDIEIKGKELTVSRFDTDEGVVSIEGDVASFRYVTSSEKPKGFLKRLFK